MTDSEFEFIRTLVYERSRISLGSDKRELVGARLAKRLRYLPVSSIGGYCRLLRSPEGEEEFVHLIDVISTHHTAFFRENDHFEFVRSTVVPELLGRFRAERWPRLQAWSAACSTGEEPYSLAMVLAESLGRSAWPWQIHATDISHRVVEQARAGVYPQGSLEAVPPTRRQAFFQRGIGAEAGNFRVSAALRSKVDFRQLNLLGAPPHFSEPFHLILCRNVMIYFDHATQEELVERLTRHLVPGGYLLVGHAESLTGIRHGLEPLQPAVYRRPAAASIAA
ncbi:MAG TPA: protein-glutamate O-methyltransferase [Opitutaceae bacterium]|nr:protein-glutamate O-methyltransferase [Opitutaceae bacterium]